MIYFLLFVLILGVIHIFYLLQYKSDFKNYTKFEDKSCPSVAVVIPVRNEEANILSCISSIQNQSYPKNNYKIIIVDDHSTDETINIIKSITTNNLQIYKVPDSENESSKINALSYGIKKCFAEIILTTDADCIVPEKWIEEHIKMYNAEVGLVTGATTFMDLKNNLLNTIATLEYAGHNCFMGAAIENGKLFTSNGSNLSFRKKAFEEVAGFENIPLKISGEDTFFAQKVFNLTNHKIKFLLSSESLVKTKTATSWKEYLLQRARWVNQTTKFPKTNLPFLVITFFFYATMNFGFIYSFFDKFLFLPLIFLFISKIGIDLYFLYSYLKKLDLLNLIKYFLLAELIHMPLTILSVLMGYFGSLNWKNRKVKF